MAARFAEPQEEGGTRLFRDAITESPHEEDRHILTMLADWADEITAADESIVASTRRHTDFSLRLRFDGKAGLVTLNQYPDGSAGVQPWRSVFEERAPVSVAEIQHIIGERLENGTGTRKGTFALLCALRQAYLVGSKPQPSGAAQA